MKNFPYFKFDTHSWLTGNIQMASLEAQGLFINIVAKSWENYVKDDEISARFFRISLKKFRKLIKELLMLNVLRIENEIIVVKFIEDEKNNAKEFSMKQSKNASFKWRKNSDCGNAKDMPEECQKDATASDWQCQKDANNNINNNINNNKEEDKEEKTSSMPFGMDDGCQPAPLPAPPDNSYSKIKGYPKSVDEVIQEAERQCIPLKNIQAENFISYFESVGWMRGKTPIYNWASALRKWYNDSMSGNGQKTLAERTGNINHERKEIGL